MKCHKAVLILCTKKKRYENYCITCTYIFQVCSTRDASAGDVSTGQYRRKHELKQLMSIHLRTSLAGTLNQKYNLVYLFKHVHTATNAVRTHHTACKQLTNPQRATALYVDGPEVIWTDAIKTAQRWRIVHQTQVISNTHQLVCVIVTFA